MIDTEKEEIPVLNRFPEKTEEEEYYLSVQNPKCIIYVAVKIKVVETGEIRIFHGCGMLRQQAQRQCNPMSCLSGFLGRPNVRYRDEYELFPI